PLSSVLVYFFFSSCYGDHRNLHSFPTRRSSDLLSFAGRTCQQSKLTRPSWQRSSPQYQPMQSGPWTGACACNLPLVPWRNRHRQASSFTISRQQAGSNKFPFRKEPTREMTLARYGLHSPARLMDFRIEFPHLIAGKNVAEQS